MVNFSMTGNEVDRKLYFGVIFDFRSFFRRFGVKVRKYNSYIFANNTIYIRQIQILIIMTCLVCYTGTLANYLGSDCGVGPVVSNPLKNRTKVTSPIQPENPVISVLSLFI